MQRREFLAASAAATFATPALAQQMPRRGGTLTMILQPEPAILNLAINQQTPVAMVCGKINQSLLSYGFDLTPKPCLAKSWEMSPDGLTYTFKLFENVQWHDGQPFTSEDVVWNHTDFLPNVHSRARLTYERIASVTAPDKYTVVFKLKQPFAPFIKTFELNSAPLYPKHVYAGTDYKTNPSNIKPIGTGPFKFAEWQSGNFIRLVRNDKYHMEGKPYLDQVILRILPDAQSRLIAVQTGQVDVASWVDIDYVLLPQLRSDPKLTITGQGYEFASPITWLEINNRVKPFDDKRVRQAVLTALDRDFIVRSIFANQCKVAHGPIASVTTHFDPNVLKRPFDPKQAEALLDEAGLKRGAGGIRFRAKLLPLPYGETWQRLAEYCRQALEKVGIGITMESADAGGWAQRVSNWDFELTINALSQYGDAALGVARSYVSSNIRKGVYATNTEGYVNKRVDELFDQAAVEIDLTKRSALYAEMQKIVTDEVPVAWIAEMKYPTVLGARVHDVVTTSDGTVDGMADAWVSA